MDAITRCIRARALTKPKVSLYLHSQPQIGYITVGPIFNVSLALLSEKKDAILNSFSVTLRHENGASHTFDWAGLSESISEIQNPMGQPVSVTKSILPLVIRVPHTGAAQSFVRFQHNRFKVNIKEPFATATEKYALVKAAGKMTTEGNLNDFLLEKEFSDVMRVFDSEFIWTAGKYTATFNIGSPNKITYRKSEYTFELSQDDIDHLRKNLEHIKHYYTQTAQVDIIPDFKPTAIPWEWRNPELKEK